MALGVTRDVVNYLRAKRLSYLGHVVRMEPLRISNIMIYSRVQGKRPIGRPRKRWLDNIKDHCHLGLLGITIDEVDRLARKRER